MLQRIEVLELVDEHVAPAPPLDLRERRVAFDGVGATGQQVVEIDQASADLLVLVAGVQAGDGRGRH